MINYRLMDFNVSLKEKNIMVGGIGKSKACTQKAEAPGVDTLLKLSLGLVLFTVIATALAYAETISVDVDGTFYDAEYAVTGMSVSGIETDLDFVSLILSVDVPDGDGTLDITFERSFFDSIYQGDDDDFIVLADGDESNFTETSTTIQSRTLSITLPSGTEEVEIIGSVFGQDVAEPPAEEPPVAEPPAEEPPVAEPPAEEPPVAEPPAEEPPVAEPPAEEPPRVQCGPGTVLKDGVCTLVETCGPGTVLKDGVCTLVETCGPGTVLKDGVCTLVETCGPGTVLKDGVCTLVETCGPGTILEDGVCVLDSTPAPASSGYFKGFGKELVYGVLAAFVVAGVVGIILALMSKASKRSN